LAIGLYELLVNPTTQLIEPPGPLFVGPSLCFEHHVDH
jgi:hypothetical protein